MIMIYSTLKYVIYHHVNFEKCFWREISNDHPTQAARSALCESLKITMPCLIEKIGKYFMLDMAISRGLALKVTLSLVYLQDRY